MHENGSHDRRRLFGGLLNRHMLLNRHIWLLVLLLLALPGPAYGQAENQAGLVVVHGDGRTLTRCVAFEEETISGMDLLTESGLDLSVDASHAMGGAVCRVDGEGCNFPQQSCFCQCQRSPCMYWSYWQREDGAWRYSQLGAAYAEVQPGDVNAWVWNQGVVGQSAEEEPPDLDLADICAATTPSAAHTPPPTQPLTGEGTASAMAAEDKPAPEGTRASEVPPEQTQEAHGPVVQKSTTEAASADPVDAAAVSGPSTPTTVVVGGLITVGLPLLVLLWLFARRRR